MIRARTTILRALATIAVVTGIVAVASPARTALLRVMGRALVVDEPMATADVVVIPEWTQAAGALEAADLVHAGVARGAAVFVAERDPATEELVRRGLTSPLPTTWLIGLLADLHVPVVDTVRVGDGTEAGTKVLPSWASRHGFRTVIIVSLPDHSRRLHRLVRRSMAGHPTKTLVRTTRYSSFDPDGWWHTRGGIRTQIQEGQKLLLDVLRHPLS